MVLSKREIVFEFREDEQGGQFLASGNVISTLRDLVSAGKLNEAARFYSSCTENVGDELLLDLEAGASEKLSAQFADVLFRARDFRRAAKLAERAGQTDLAARCYEADYDFSRSGQHYLAAGMREKAAEVAERNQEFERAAGLYEQVGNGLRAAQNYERAGHFLKAGKLYLREKKAERAAQTLQRVQLGREGWIEACWLLGNLYQGSQPQVAAKFFLMVAKNAPVSKETVVVYYRLGELYQAAGRRAEANHLYRLVSDFMPTYAEVAIRLIDTNNDSDEEVLDLDEPAASSGPPSMTGVEADFYVLGALPIFEGLSLDELKLVYDMTDRVSFRPGESLIVEGQPGEGLLVLVHGQAKVSRGTGATQIVLQQLRSGDCVGELSLIDEAPTSADVTAVGPVEAFRLPRDPFRQLLNSNDRIALRFYQGFLGVVAQRLRRTSRRLTGAHSIPSDG